MLSCFFSIVPNKPIWYLSIFFIARNYNFKSQPLIWISSVTLEKVKPLFHINMKSTLVTINFSSFSTSVVVFCIYARYIRTANHYFCISWIWDWHYFWKQINNKIKIEKTKCWFLVIVWIYWKNISKCTLLNSAIDVARNHFCKFRKLSECSNVW